MTKLLISQNWFYTLVACLLLFSCVKEDETPTSGDIQLICKNEYVIGAEYNVITEYAFLSLMKDNIYLNTASSSIRTGTVSYTTEISGLNPGNYYITFNKETLFNYYQVVQVSAGKKNKYELK